MKNPDQAQKTIDALRERITRLTEASVRINSSLELRDVLREVLEKARTLTGARYGYLIAVDEDGTPMGYVNSGFTREMRDQMREWPDGARLYEHVRDHPGPVRISDAEAYVRELGLSLGSLPITELLGLPMGHRGQNVGHFFLGSRHGDPPFTAEDDELLVLFASQAATAIANARAYRRVERARADLEALVETTPIGVVVFDAGNGRPLWLNRETRRIAESVSTPGISLLQFLEIMNCRRGDGTEISFREFPVSWLIVNDASRVRAEEMVLSMPDGRSVTVLVNATPIRGETGEVVSMVVTLQDLAPLQEIERLRAQFIGIVSQELRAPLTSIKGAAAALLDSSAALGPDERRDYARIIDGQTDRMRNLIGELLDIGRIETGTLTVLPEPWEVTALVDRARHAFLKGNSPHPVLVDLPADLPRVTAERRRIVQVLGNLFAYAARHSPAASPIRVSAAQDGPHVAISVSDEGRSVAPERLHYLFRKYTASADEEDSGGLGLAICKGLVEAHGGRIWAESAGQHRGARVSFTLPVAEEQRDGSGVPDKSAQVPQRGSILMLGEDPPTLRYVRDVLTEAGYRPIMTGDHRELGHLIRDEAPRLALLDLTRPASRGIDLMRHVPELGEIPVIFISDRERDDIIARALQGGAADYVAKPFSATELTARIAAALRTRARPEPFKLGGLSIDYDRRSASVDGRAVELTATEFELLRVLSLSAGRVVTFDSLIRRVWNRRHGNSKLLRVFIKSLRAKLGDDAGDPSYIFTRRGVGYRLGEPE